MTNEKGDVESAPPAYSRGRNADSQPPSYESLYEKIKVAKRDSNGNTEFIKSFCAIITSSIGFLILLGVLLAVPILSIVIGALNLNNCPVERFIPIWLVVAGACSALQQLIGLVERIKKRINQPEEIEGDDSSSTPSKFACFNSLFSCFNFAWFIAGCVWVYSNFAPNTEDISSLGYCDHTTYYLAFWLLTLAFIFMGLIMFCCCCVVCCVGAAAATGSD